MKQNERKDGTKSRKTPTQRDEQLATSQGQTDRASDEAMRYGASYLPTSWLNSGSATASTELEKLVH